MITVSTNEFRDNLAEYIDSIVRDDTPVVVKRFGKPLVKVVPYKKEKVDDFERFFGFMGSGVDGETYVNRIRRNKKEKDRIKKLRNRNA